MQTIKVHNKNIIWELLQGDSIFNRIEIVKNLKEDRFTKQILQLARQKEISIEQLLHRKMPRGRSGKNREVLIAYLEVGKDWHLSELITDLESRKQIPFFLLLNRVSFANNIGVIARTAFAAGVNGIIYQGDRSQFLNEETIHYSMGTINRIPLVKMNIFQAINVLKKNNIWTLALQIHGSPYYSSRLSGAIALVVGAEGEGLSDTVSKRCDQQISIPMQRGIDSLNVGISTAIVMYEKVRQEQ